MAATALPLGGKRLALKFQVQGGGFCFLSHLTFQVEEATQKSGPVHRIAAKLLETQAGLRSVQERLRGPSSNVADAKRAQKVSGAPASCKCDAFAKLQSSICQARALLRLRAAAVRRAQQVARACGGAGGGRAGPGVSPGGGGALGTTAGGAAASGATLRAGGAQDQTRQQGGARRFSRSCQFIAPLPAIWRLKSIPRGKVGVVPPRL